MDTDKLLAFFRSEFHAEESTGFARLKRVPDSYAQEGLAWYQSLSAADRASFVDCAAHYAAGNYGFVIVTERPQMAALLRSGELRDLQTVLGAILEEKVDHTKHPFLERWADPGNRFRFRTGRNVMLLRTMVQQYKMDKKRGMPSCISERDFQIAESMRDIKAPALKKRLRATLDKFSYQQTDTYGGHRCTWDGVEFQFNADFGARDAQMRYSATPLPYRAVHPMGNFCFEMALGMGFGHWNYIVEENVDDVFALLEELIKYAVELPQRIVAACR
jgi:hypothetical protein